MSIRPATEDDVPAITDLLRTSGLPTADVTPALCRHFRVLCDGETSVRGTVGLQVFGSVALLRSLAVHPDLQGRGFGQSLVLDVEAHARSEAVRAVYLLTETARPFFEQLGYAVIDREVVPPDVAATKEFEELCGRAATCMWKQLGTPAFA